MQTGDELRMLVFVIHGETQEVDPVTQQAGDSLYTYCCCLIGIASLVHVCPSHCTLLSLVALSTESNMRCQ